MAVDLWSSFEAHSLMNRKLDPSSFHHASLNHDISTCIDSTAARPAHRPTETSTDALNVDFPDFKQP